MKQKTTNDGQDNLGRVLKALRRNEPALSNSDQMTEEIMDAIGDQQDHKNSRAARLIYLQRFLAAASVCLALTLGIEQYIVVEKINRLEQRNENIEITPYASLTSRFAFHKFPLPQWQQKTPLRDKILSATSKFALKKMQVKFQKKQP